MYFEFKRNRIRCNLRGRRMWFVGKDIMSSLGYENPEKSLPKYIDADDSMELTVRDTIGREEAVTAINTYGVHKLITIAGMINICSSETIKEFKVWLDEVIQPIIEQSIERTVSDEDMAILKIVHAKSDTEKASGIKEFKDLIIQQTKAEMANQNTPVVKTSRTKIDPSSLMSIKDATEMLGLKKGQILRWASNNDMFQYRGASKRSPYVPEKGFPFFRVYNSKTTVGLIGVTDAGLRCIEEHIDEIKETKLVNKREGSL